MYPARDIDWDQRNFNVLLIYISKLEHNTKFPWKFHPLNSFHGIHGADTQYAQSLELLIVPPDNLLMVMILLQKTWYRLMWWWLITGLACIIGSPSVFSQFLFLSWVCPLGINWSVAWTSENFKLPQLILGRFSLTVTFHVQNLHFNLFLLSTILSSLPWLWYFEL